MRYELLRSVVGELAALLPGMLVKRVFQGAQGINIILHRPKKDLILLISPDRKMPRLHLLRKKPQALLSPHAMVLYLRSHLTGALVRGIAIVNNDRVVELLLASRDGDFRLMVELTGSTANLVLIDEASVIKSVYFPVPPTDAHKRSLFAGLRYVLPTARDLQPVEALSQDERASASLDGPPASREDSAENRAAEAFFDESFSNGQLETHRKDLLRTLAKHVARTMRRVEALSKSLAVSDRAEEFRKTGDLILANLAGLERGQEQATLADYDGTVTVVRLDPRCSPSKNAEQYFKKYKKAKSGVAILSARLSRAAEETAALRRMQAAVESAPDSSALVRLQSEMDAQGFHEARQVAVKQARPADPLSYRRTVFSGWEILIGRSAAGNDYLTTKLARPGDIWLHAEGMPGSHVLVRNPGGTPMPAEVLTKAASYAAFYSKGRGSGKVPVTYTAARNVSKPKGAKPGMVVLSERQSIMAHPEELREEGRIS